MVEPITKESNGLPFSGCVQAVTEEASVLDALIWFAAWSTWGENTTIIPAFFNYHMKYEINIKIK